MAETAADQLQLINPLLNVALVKAAARRGPLSVWDVVRQLSQGVLTVAVAPKEGAPSAFDPTSVPKLFPTPQSVLTINSDKGPLLVAFTYRNVNQLLPPGSPENLVEEQRAAIEVAGIARQEPYVGLLIDPGTPHAFALGSEYITAGLDGANGFAKELIGKVTRGENAKDPALREAVVRAVAGGPMYTPVNRAMYAANRTAQFLLQPLGPQPAPGEQPAPGAETAIIFGTSQAEINAVCDPEQWAPMPIRINDAVKNVQKIANLKLVVINPAGPALQLPVTGIASSSGGAPSTEGAANEGATTSAEALEDLLNEPTPEPGASTEPDAGTREGED